MTNPTPPVADPTAKRRRINRLILGGVGAVLGVLVLLGVIGAVVGKDKDKGRAVAPSTTAAARTAAAATTTPAAAAPAQPSAPAAAPASPRAASDPRCAPAAAETIALVQAGLSHSGWSLTNGTVLDAGGRMFVGATIVDESGKMRERSDVWIVTGGKVYASTGGARNNSTFPKASAAPLSISPGDEAVQAVDACVIAQTLGR